MSWHEISSDMRYLITCDSCAFKLECRTPGGAEAIADAHITDEKSNNYSHTVYIQEVRVIGRNV